MLTYFLEGNWFTFILYFINKVCLFHAIPKVRYLSTDVPEHTERLYDKDAVLGDEIKRKRCLSIN